LCCCDSWLLWKVSPVFSAENSTHLIIKYSTSVWYRNPVNRRRSSCEKYRGKTSQIEILGKRDSKTEWRVFFDSRRGFSCGKRILNIERDQTRMANRTGRTRNTDDRESEAAKSREKESCSWIRYKKVSLYVVLEAEQEGFWFH
jgi:hypothetical protein